jgi:hypothetical protein
MVNLKDKVQAEYENIDKLIDELPAKDELPFLQFLELAGVATILHNFYNGIENILKLSLKEKNVPFPNGASWHKELLKLSVNHKIITEATMIKLGEYLAFRHFFNHSYALDLYAEKLEPLVENIRGIYKDFQKDISSYLAKLK